MVSRHHLHSLLWNLTISPTNILYYYGYGYLYGIPRLRYGVISAANWRSRAQLHSTQYPKSSIHHHHPLPKPYTIHFAYIPRSSSLIHGAHPAHAVRCQANYTEVNGDCSCHMPHDDESAEVEEVGRVRVGDETFWGGGGG